MNTTTKNKTKDLWKALLTPKTEAEMAALCRDLMTTSEIEEFASRLSVAKELYLGKTQRRVAKETGVSIATVTRVNQWLRKGMGGYLNVLKHNHKLKPLASNSG